jgi:hypothetical protein
MTQKLRQLLSSFVQFFVRDLLQFGALSLQAKISSEDLGRYFLRREALLIILVLVFGMAVHFLLLLGNHFASHARIMKIQIGEKSGICSWTHNS